MEQAEEGMGRGLDGKVVWMENEGKRWAEMREISKGRQRQNESRSGDLKGFEDWVLETDAKSKWAVLAMGGRCTTTSSSVIFHCRNSAPLHLCTPPPKSFTSLMIQPLHINPYRSLSSSRSSTSSLSLSSETSMGPSVIISQQIIPMTFALPPSDFQRSPNYQTVPLLLHPS